MIPLFHPDYRTPDYAAQLRDLPHDIAGLSAQNAKPIGDPALFDKSIEVVHELIQRNIISRYGRGATSAARAAADEGQLARQLSDSLLRLSSSTLQSTSSRPGLPEGVPVPNRTISGGGTQQPEGGEPEPESEPASIAVAAAGNYHGLTNAEDFAQVARAKVVHIISTPYDKANPVAGRKAVATKDYHDNPALGVYVFNPNTGLRAAAEAQGMSEAEQGRQWLKLWTEVMEKVSATGGKCFVMAKSVDGGGYTLEGGAQSGEVNVAKFALDPEPRSGHEGPAGWECDRIEYVLY